MTKSRYKFFRNIEYAEQFLAGEIYHQSLAFFRDYEDSASKGVIGDRHEAAHIFRPTQGLQINLLKQRKSLLLSGAAFETYANASEIMVSCMSISLSDEIIENFEATAYVEIKNVRKLISRWQAGLPSGSQHFARKVIYYRPDELPDNVWPQPDLIATHKMADYKYQQEFRLGFSTPGTLDFNNITAQINYSDGPIKPAPNEHKSRIVNAGNLKDICSLHKI